MALIVSQTVSIKAPPEKIWELLADTRTWSRWSSAIVASEGGCKAELDCSIRFSVCIMGIRFTVEPIIDALEENSRIVWTGTKLGIHSRHEFQLIEENGGTRIESTEVLTGLTTYLPGFPLGRVRALTRIMLRELKTAAEAQDTVS